MSGESLSPYASVYRGRSRDGREVIVKRTASGEQRARAMAAWVRALHDAGIPVVTPVPVGSPNPQQVGKDWWVVYPYVDGRPFDGSDDDLRQAGELLGRLHAAPVDDGVLSGLRYYEWPATSGDDVDDDLAVLDERLREHGGDRAEESVQTVRALAQRWLTHSLPALLAAEDVDPLPRAGVTSDYKAANLVYSPGSGPTLVDPDNGGLEPRLLDLAMAVVLLHNECPTAPARMMSTDEWGRFYAGYATQVTLTASERALWPAALDHMLWEEGTWVLEDNDDAAWADPRQGGYLRDLARTTPDRYPLP